MGYFPAPDAPAPTAPSHPMTPEHFITRWSGASGSELANAQSFTRELCELLELPVPDPAQADTRDNAYVFERRVMQHHRDGTTSERRIDCYRRGAFVLEAKKIKASAPTKGFDNAPIRAFAQAGQYATDIAPVEGRPPFLIVVDVGHMIELYAEFTRSGGTYTPFPDPRSHRIRLADLAEPAIRERLRAIWLDPLSLDPARAAGIVTREISDHLASVAKTLESAGHPPEAVAHFLSRCLFCFFAEDVGLLPKRSFTELLESLQHTPDQFVPMIAELWRAMDVGDFSVALRCPLPRFNGKLFKQPQVLPLNRDQIGLLVAAGLKDWTRVEPAIFGTLLERALDPTERHSLGAHYTPRAYVERLVLPTVIEPLRAEWANVQAAAVLLANEGKLAEARAEITAWHHRLCQVRVLDPACGSANFLYVTLEHMKRLEGEVLNQLDAFGPSQGLLEGEGLTVDPHQFLGLELNPRAAAIAELVLWIGYLQWHFRTKGSGLPPQPVLRDFKNIENRDALIAYDGVELVTGGDGKPLTRWDGVTYKTSPVTGERIPDEAAQLEQVRYINPRKATWPKADYIVGNPPFIGAATMRRALGDGYVDAVRSTWPEVPESADFVMHWWHIAGEAVRAEKARRFGFITTNSIRQTFNRRVVQAQLEAKPPLSLAFAIPDHPWVDATDGAAVRIAMTVGAADSGEGSLALIRDETETDGDARSIALVVSSGVLHSDLRIGANIAASTPLLANGSIANRGVQILASGFIVSADEAAQLDPLQRLSVPYRNGKDITDRPRGVIALDPYPMSELELRAEVPSVYQWLLTRAKPERDLNPRASYRDNWWLFGENQPLMRRSIESLKYFIVTAITARHRVFQFLQREIMPDQALLVIASDDALVLGILSSRLHVCWALAAGGRLGVGNDPRYNKSRCFEPFPFPAPSAPQTDTIRKLAAQIDSHRKRQQAAHANLTLTGIYNVLEKLRSGEALTAKEKTLHEQGLVSVLRELHDELDRAVFAAYGWDDLADRLVGKPGATTPLPDKPDDQTETEEELLCRLVAHNTARGAEEAQGQIRWLRPNYQSPGHGSGPAGDAQQVEIETRDEEATAPATKADKHPWPPGLPGQVALGARVLAGSPRPPPEPAPRPSPSPGSWRGCPAPAPPRCTSRPGGPTRYGYTWPRFATPAWGT